MLHHVGQFADVAGPAVGGERGERGRVGDRRVRRRLRPSLPHEVLHEHGDVIAAVAEGRNRDLERVDPKQQVFAEVTRLHHLLERPVRGADHPHVDRDRMVVADAANLTTLQGPQQP